MNRPLRPILAGFLAEALVWYGLGAAFLAAYAALHAAEGRAVAAHLSLLTTLWGCVACVRIAVWQWVPGPRLARGVNALLVTAALVTLVAYYTAVLVGLQSWGRVVSWRLIETYALQSTDLLGVLGVSPIAALAGASSIVLGIFLVLAGKPARLDWARGVARSLSPQVLSVCVLSGLSIVSVRLYAFTTDPPARDGEPVSLTFFPEQASRARQSHTWGNLPARETAENEARSRYVPAATASRRNVILIVGDALRPDHMSVYGYDRDTTPYLDAMARDGRLTKAERMVAACAESSCGLMAIARSKYVHEFSDRDFSFQEVLRRHGYRIHLVLSGDHTNFYGLRDAYGEVDSYHDGASARDRYMNDDQLVIDRVAALPAWDGQPVMFQFHLMSTHGLGTRHASSQRYQPATNYYGVDVLRADGPAAHAAEVVNFYDNGVLQFDRLVGRMLDDLKAKGYLDDALVVITADHGELLGEYGRVGHARTIHEEVLRVPFLLLHFGHRPGRPIAEAQASSQVDIAPTLLAEMRMPIPSTWSGRPLQQPSSRRFLRFQQGAQVGLLDLGSPDRVWKYWVDFRTAEEFAIDATGRADESVNRIGEVAESLRREWKRTAMDAGAAVVVRDGCCSSHARLE